MCAEAELAELVRPGCRVALADGVGAPRSLSGLLSAVSREAGGVRLLLGWTPAHDPVLELGAFADVRTIMSGWGLRRSIDAGLVRYVPARLSGVPALLHSALRPDVVVASVVPVPGGWALAAEEGWVRAAVDAGARVAGVVATALPRADAEPPLPREAVTVVGESDLPAVDVPTVVPGPVQQALGERVAALVPAGAALQVGPGPLAAAVLAALRVPVHVDTGLLTDGVVDLEQRGLLLGTARGTYLAGTDVLYKWADGRPLLRRVEHTHDPGRRRPGPLVAVNTALEIDLDGQVNVERTGPSAVGGIGGHPDFAAAAARSVGGLSVIAIATHHGGHSTLVPRLAAPVSTAGHDVDVIVTECGSADLRGLSRTERRVALTRLWGKEA